MTPTTLLTGAGGFVGSHVLESLLERTDRDVVVTDSFRHNGVFDRLLPILSHPERVDVVPHDLTVPIPTVGPWRDYLRGVDSIVHVASLCQVDMSIREPAWFITNNVLSTINTLELARFLDVRFIQMSTDEVHGVSGSYHAPSSPYAASKAAQEDICHAYLSTYGVPVSVVQSCNMFGERQSQLAFIPKIIKALLTGDRLHVHVDRDGNPGERWYTYVRNVATYVTDLIDDAPQLHLFRHQLSGQDNVSNVDLVERVAALMGRDAEYELIAAESVRPGYDRSYESLYENDRWNASVSFDQGLANTVRWAEENPAWLNL